MNIYQDYYGEVNLQIKRTFTEQLKTLNSKVNVLEDIVFSEEISNTLSNIENLKSGEELNVSFPTNVSLTKSITIKPNTKVTLNLTNNEIKVDTPNIDALLIDEEATLIIDGDGMIETANNGNGFPLIAQGKVIIKNGTFKSGYDENHKANACIYAKGNGEIEIYGGRFETLNGDYVLNKKDSDRATTSIKVMGGEFVEFDPSNNKSEGPNTNFVADGYKVETFKENGKTIYKVVKK